MRTQDILDHLEKFIAFKAIAEQGSLRKGAEVLNIAQPSLTVKLHNLEEALGYELFIRSRRGVVLTTEGQRVLSFVNKLVDQAEDLKIDLEKGGGPLQGHIRLGMYDSIARYIWPGFYRQYSKAFPGISISIFTGRSQQIIDQLESNKLDVALTVEPRENYQMDVDLLYEDYFSFYGNKQYLQNQMKLKKRGAHYLLEGAGITPYSLILFPHAITENGVALERLLKLDKRQRFLIHRVESFELAHSFCLEGVGLAVLPHRVAEKAFEKGKLVKIKVGEQIPINFGKHKIGLSLINTNKFNPVVEHVVDHLKKYIS